MPKFKIDEEGRRVLDMDEDFYTDMKTLCGRITEKECIESLPVNCDFCGSSNLIELPFPEKFTEDGTIVQNGGLFLCNGCGMCYFAFARKKYDMPKIVS